MDFIPFSFLFDDFARINKPLETNSQDDYLVTYIKNLQDIKKTRRRNRESKSKQ